MPNNTRTRNIRSLMYQVIALQNVEDKIVEIGHQYEQADRVTYDALSAVVAAVNECKVTVKHIADRL